MKPNLILLVACVAIFSGCATKPVDDKPRTSKIDPFENVNRKTAVFNDRLDENVVQPVARAYTTVFPSFVQTGIGNFFGNINDVWTSINSFLQGNPEDGFTDIMRFSINSTFGFLGVLDIASEGGIAKHRKDFGQTLAVWGVPNGPYLVVPFLGPSVMRDTLASPVDYYADIWSYERPVAIRNTGTVLRLVDKRAGYLDASTLLEDAALDKYAFTRDAYLQRIGGQVDATKDAQQNREDEAAIKKQNVDDAQKEQSAPETTPAPKTP